MERANALFGTPFLQRFSRKRILIPLLGVFFVGILLGSSAVESLDFFQQQTAMPLLFSGIPSPQKGFFPCFSTILLNAVIGLILLFLLGVTAFGALGIPCFLLCKGVSLGISVQLLLVDGNRTALGYVALCYTPGAACTSLLLLLFATRALIFSNSLVKAGFSSQQESLDFQFYFKDFRAFLCFAVLFSFLGTIFTMLSSLFV